MNYVIEYDSAPKHEDNQILLEGIIDYAKEMRGHERGKQFAYFIKDEGKKIKGGCFGCIFYGCMYIDTLWIDQTLRAKKYGTQLMQRAETLAIENQCNFIAVNTMDWEALGFYKKLGFYVEFERRGFDKNSVFYFLRKDLF